MIEVLKKGTNQTHTITCKVCGSKLKFNEYDVQVWHNVAKNYFGAITCPVCHKDIKVCSYEEVDHHRAKGSIGEVYWDKEV